MICTDIKINFVLNDNNYIFISYIFVLHIILYITFNNLKYSLFFSIILRNHYRNIPPGALASAANFFYFPNYNGEESLRRISVLEM
jgi:hypothetical protein